MEPPEKYSDCPGVGRLPSGAPWPSATGSCIGTTQIKAAYLSDSKAAAALFYMCDGPLADIAMRWPEVSRSLGARQKKHHNGKPQNEGSDDPPLRWSCSVSNSLVLSPIYLLHRVLQLGVLRLVVPELMSQFQFVDLGPHRMLSDAMHHRKGARKKQQFTEQIKSESPLGHEHKRELTATQVPY
jgi:hypothetical protein